MTVAQSILNALAQAAAPITAADLAKHLDQDRAAVSRTLFKLKADKRISYRRPDSGWGIYYLTEDQAAAALSASKPARSSRANKATKQPASPLAKLVTAPEVARRLRFLTDLSQRPAFVGHALLAEIINDYRRALSRTVSREDRRHE